MSEKPEDDFEDEAEDLADSEDLDLDHIMRDLDTGKRRGRHAPVSDPAWRRLERLREEKRTAELLSDFDDYDIDAGDAPGRGHGHGLASRSHKPQRGGGRRH